MNIFDELPTVYKVLNKYGARLVKEMQTRLKTYNSIATGKLLKTISYQIAENEDATDIEMFYIMEEYGNYIDAGVNGKKKSYKSIYTFKRMPNINAIAKWCKIKGIPKKFAPAISQNLLQYGMKPKPFFTATINRNNNIFYKELSEAYKTDIKNLIEQNIIK